MALQASETASFLGHSGHTRISKMGGMLYLPPTMPGSQARKTESVKCVDFVGAQYALAKCCASSIQLTKHCHYCAIVLERGSMLVASGTVCDPAAGVKALACLCCCSCTNLGTRDFYSGVGLDSRADCGIEMTDLGMPTSVCVCNACAHQTGPIHSPLP